MAIQYYVVIGNVQRGPFVKDELARQGLGRETLVWSKGLPDWLPASRVPALLDLFEQPPPLPGAEPAPLPLGDRPPIPEPGAISSSAQIKDPDLALPRVEMPRTEAPRTETPPPVRPVYPDEIDEPPVVPRQRIAYDVVGMRRLYVAGMSVYVPGLVLILAVLVTVAFLAIYGIRDRRREFDIGRREFVEHFEPAGRTLQTLATVFTIAASVLGVIGLAVGAACFFVLLYRAWVVLQDGRTRPTAGRAVGFMFMPLFNIYWDFIAVLGVARRLNRFTRRHELDAPSASQPLGAAISAYNVLTYIPMIGLVPLGLNLLLFPLFTRSLYRTLAVICDDANRERLTHANREPTVRQTDVGLPVSANILSIAATVLAPIAVGLFVGGFCGTLAMLREDSNDARNLEAQRDAARQLRNLANAKEKEMVRWDWNDDNRLQHHEREAHELEHRLSVRRSEDLIIGWSVLGGGVVLFAITITLAFVSRACAQGADSAVLHPPES
jgi:hypothetical protein